MDGLRGDFGKEYETFETIETYKPDRIMQILTKNDITFKIMDVLRGDFGKEFETREPDKYHTLYNMFNNIIMFNTKVIIKRKINKIIDMDYLLKVYITSTKEKGDIQFYVIDRWYSKLLKNTMYPCSCGSIIPLENLPRHAKTGIMRHNRARENLIYNSSYNYMNRIFSNDILFIINSYVYEHIIINYEGKVKKKHYVY
jgi:hypothetical protein